MIHSTRAWHAVFLALLVTVAGSAHAQTVADLLRSAKIADPPIESGVYTNRKVNYRFRIPPGYEPFEPEDESAHDRLDLALVSRSGRHYLITASFDYGLDYTQDELAEATVERLRNDQDELTVLRQQPRNLGGIEGRLVDLSARKNGLSYTHRIWVSNFNGFTFQLTSTQQGEGSRGFLALSNQAFAGFEVIDPEQKSSEHWSQLPLARTASAAFGYTLETGAPWYASPLWQEGYGQADTLGASRSGAEAFAVLPVCHGDLRPSPSALLAVLGDELLDVDFVQRRSEREVSSGVASGVEFIVEDEDVLQHLWLLTAGDCSYAITRVASLPENSTDQAKEEFLAAFRWSAPALADAETTLRETNAARLTSLGDHFQDAGAYRSAVGYYQAAREHQPGSYPLVASLSAAYNALGAYDEGLTAAQAALEDFGEPTDLSRSQDQDLRSWLAWFSHKLDRDEAALEAYRALFAEGYRSDEELDVLLDLLADAEQWAELDRALNDFQVSQDQAERQLRVAKIEIRKDQLDSARDRLGRLDPGQLSPAQRRSLVKLYLDLDDFPLALTLTDQLLAEGYESASVLYNRGDAFFSLGQYKDAQAAFSRALELAPGNSSVLDYLDYVNSFLGEDSTELVSQVIEPVPLPASIVVPTAADAAERDDGEFDRVYLLHATGYQIGRDKPLKRTRYRRFQVLNAAGVKNASTLTLTFDSGDERLYVNSLTVRDAAGQIVTEADRSRFFLTTADDSITADDERTLNLPVPQLKPGAIVELIYTTESLGEKGRFPLRHEYLVSGWPVAKLLLYVDGAVDTLSYREHLLGPPEDTDAGNWVWSRSWPTPYVSESRTPPSNTYLPWVLLGSPRDSWAKVGDGYLADIAHTIDPATVADEVERVVDGLPDRASKIDAIVRYVQDNITYNAIEFGRRSYMPRPAQETLRDRYGDCKDHAVLLHAMLTAAQIPSELALASTDEYVVSDLPSLDQFNHMIVHLPEDQLFIDSTDKHLHLPSHTPRFLQQDQVLVLTAPSRLEQVPPVAVAESTVAVERRVRLEDSDRAQIVETMRLHGYAAVPLRETLKATQARDRHGVLARWLTGSYPQAKLVDYKLNNLHRLENDLEIELSYAWPLLTGAEGELVLPFFLEDWSLVPAATEPRRNPAANNVPEQFSSTTTVEAPSGLLVASQVKADGGVQLRSGALQDGAIQWQMSVDSSPSKAVVHFTYSEDRWRSPAAQFDGHKDALSKMHRQLSQSLVWER